MICGRRGDGVLWKLEVISARRSCSRRVCLTDAGEVARSSRVVYALIRSRIRQTDKCTWLTSLSIRITSCWKHCYMIVVTSAVLRRCDTPRMKGLARRSAAIHPHSHNTPFKHHFLTQLQNTRLRQGLDIYFSISHHTSPAPPRHYPTHSLPSSLIHTPLPFHFLH